MHRSSCATLDCLINEIAVTNVSIALENSPAAASETALHFEQKSELKYLKKNRFSEKKTYLAIAELLTVRFLAIISSNSTSLNCGVIPASGNAAGPTGLTGGPGHGPLGPP